VTPPVVVGGVAFMASSCSSQYSASSSQEIGLPFSYDTSWHLWQLPPQKITGLESTGDQYQYGKIENLPFHLYHVVVQS